MVYNMLCFRMLKIRKRRASLRRQKARKILFHSGDKVELPDNLVLKDLMGTNSKATCTAVDSIYDLNRFLHLARKNWREWTLGVEEQRQLALAAVCREPTVSSIEASTGLERLMPQMLEVDILLNP